MRLIAEPVRRYPSGFGRALCALDFYLGTPKEIVVLGDPESTDTHALLREIWKPYLPNKVVVQTNQADDRSAAVIPLLRGRTLLNDKPTAYVCEHFTCSQPVTEPEKLASQLAYQRPASGAISG